MYMCAQQCKFHVQINQERGEKKIHRLQKNCAKVVGKKLNKICPICLLSPLYFTL